MIIIISRSHLRQIRTQFNNYLRSKNIYLKQRQLDEKVAHLLGYKDFNTLIAAIKRFPEYEDGNTCSLPISFLVSPQLVNDNTYIKRVLNELPDDFDMRVLDKESQTTNLKSVNAFVSCLRDRVLMNPTYHDLIDYADQVKKVYAKADFTDLCRGFNQQELSFLVSVNAGGVVSVKSKTQLLSWIDSVGLGLHLDCGDKIFIRKHVIYRYCQQSGNQWRVTIESSKKITKPEVTISLKQISSTWADTSGRGVYTEDELNELNISSINRRCEIEFSATYRGKLILLS